MNWFVVFPDICLLLIAVVIWILYIFALEWYSHHFSSLTIALLRLVPNCLHCLPIFFIKYIIDSRLDQRIRKLWVPLLYCSIIAPFVGTGGSGITGCFILILVK